MIDYSLIKLVPAHESHREFSYQVKKKAEGEYITQMFGWDESKERDFHTKDWQRHKPEIIAYDGEPIGTLATIDSKDYIDIGQFFLLPDYQNMGIGTHLLKSILDKTDQLERTTTLKLLRNNPAKSLYSRHGFQVVSIDENFCFMERKPG